MKKIAPDVGWLATGFANVYFVGRPGDKWALIDSGLSGYTDRIVEAAEARFGGGARPEAIYLTHGHGDHSGSARGLAEKWRVPIYAHRREMPYLTGRSKYPPKDPTVGGAIAFLSRFMPSSGADLSGHLRELPENDLPGLPEWRWTTAFGHAPGQVVFFRPSDRSLIAGDALATVDMDSWVSLLTGKQELARAGTPFTIDWRATRRSVEKLAELRPNLIGAGHGRPMHGDDLPARLEKFAENFEGPRHGRYASQPAQTNEDGVVYVPPPPMDPIPLITAAGMLAVGIALGSGLLERWLED